MFISYRRDDSPAQAGRLFDRISGELGERFVFMDVDSIGWLGRRGHDDGDQNGGGEPGNGALHGRPPRRSTKEHCRRPPVQESGSPQSQEVRAAVTAEIERLGLREKARDYTIGGAGLLALLTAYLSLTSPQCKSTKVSTLEPSVQINLHVRSSSVRKFLVQGCTVHSTFPVASVDRRAPSASASVWFAVFGFAAIIGFLLLPYAGLGGDGQNFYYMGISAAATWAVLAGAQRVRRSRRLPWLLLAAGQFCYTVGDVAYYISHAVLDNDAFPAPADLFYLLQYPLVGAALVLLVRRRTPAWDTAALLDAAILAIGFGMLWWVYLIGPLAADVDGSESLASTLVSIAYPVMDLIVLATAIRLAVGSGSRSTAFRLLMASLLAMLVADMVYGLQTAADTYSDGGVPDVLWLAEYVLLGAAALHPSMRSMDHRAKVALPNVTAGRVIMLSLAALLPLIVLSTQYTLVVLVFGFCLFALVMTRMWLVLDIQQRLAIADELTGLKARGVLLSHLDLEVKRGLQQRYEMGLVLLDVDQFRLIVQIQGQPAGHEVLAELSDRLVRLCGDAAVLGRVGDNAFAAVLPGYDSVDLVHAAARIREVVEQEKFAIGEQEEIRVTVSVGVASLHRDGASSTELLEHAEQALRRAKSAGRNRVYSTTGPADLRR